MRIYVSKSVRGSYTIIVVGKAVGNVRLSAGEFEKLLEMLHRVEQHEGLTPYTQVLEIRGVK